LLELEPQAASTSANSTATAVTAAALINVI
jgi:hypothetical protein